jgi:phosphatidylserine/phosphatidylglycerophosphate/cardiolipin synthase-like enzyme
LAHAFLAKKLKGARSYLRIARYFRRSIYELVGEEIPSIPHVRVVCNSELDPADITVSKAARETGMKERWNAAVPEVEALLRRERYRRLHELPTGGRVEIRVVPKDRVFVHGKAGVIETEDGSKTCFLGSINETKEAFSENYEILWEDTSPEGVAWVEEEFEALWRDSFPLPDAIVEEIARVAVRTEVRFEEVAPRDMPAAALAESPIYRGGERLSHPTSERRKNPAATRLYHIQPILRHRPMDRREPYQGAFERTDRRVRGRGQERAFP